MIPPGTLIRIMKASPPCRCGYIPTHFRRSCSPGTLAMESGPCFEYVSMTAWATSNGCRDSFSCSTEFSSPMLR